MRRFAAVLAASLLATSVSVAEDSAEDTVKYRQSVFMSMAMHMKGSSMIAKGQISSNEDLKAHAASLKASGDMLGKLFPEGTGPDKIEKTEALPIIWEKRADFDKALDAYKKATTDFAAAADAGEWEKAKVLLGGIGKSCGGCHDTFRKDDD